MPEWTIDSVLCDVIYAPFNNRYALLEFDLVFFSYCARKNGKYKQAQYNARWILRRSNSYRKELLV